MALKLRLALLLIFFGFSIGAHAQYTDFLGLSEKQVREKVKNFHSVTRDSSAHELVQFLTYKNEKDEVEVVFYFFVDSCYMVRHYVEKEALAAAIKSADKQHVRIRDNFWRDKEEAFEILIDTIADKGVITYSKGSSDW